MDCFRVKRTWFSPVTMSINPVTLAYTLEVQKSLSKKIGNVYGTKLVRKNRIALPNVLSHNDGWGANEQWFESSVKYRLQTQFHGLVTQMKSRCCNWCIIRAISHYEMDILSNFELTHRMGWMILMNLLWLPIDLGPVWQVYLNIWELRSLWIELNPSDLFGRLSNGLSADILYIFREGHMCLNYYIKSTWRTKFWGIQEKEAMGLLPFLLTKVPVYYFLHWSLMIALALLKTEGKEFIHCLQDLVLQMFTDSQFSSIIRKVLNHQILHVTRNTYMYTL